MTHTQGVVSDTDLEAQRQRNREKVARIVSNMGTKYVCHPANVLRKDPARANFTPAESKVLSAPLLFRTKGGVK